MNKGIQESRPFPRLELVFTCCGAPLYGATLTPSIAGVFWNENTCGLLNSVMANTCNASTLEAEAAELPGI